MSLEELKEKMIEKIEEEEFEVSDLPEFLNLFCQMCNESEDVQDEIDNWTHTFQINMDNGESFWIKMASMSGATEHRSISNPGFRLLMTRATWNSA